MRRSPRQVTSSPLESATVKDFSGGWNTSSSELSIDSKYAVIEDNMFYGTSGTLQARQGTELFADLDSLATDYFVDGYFFYAYVISVAEDGSIYATDGASNSARIWPKDGSPAWSATTAVSFVEMNGDLIIHNGVNKPLRIRPNLQTDYLTDVDGTNLDIPIGLVAAKHGDWHVIATDSTINISHTRSPGTFAGDPPPNIATSVNLSARVSRGSKTITAMMSYRDVLIVMFEQCIIPIGITTDASPATALVINIDDAIDSYGAFSHRTIQNLGDDVIFCDIVGVQSVSRTVFSKTLTPEYESQIISSAVQKALNELSTVNLREKVFSVFDTNEKAYMLFVPRDDLEAAAYERYCFVKVDQTKPKKVETWSRFRGWNWSYACRSAEGNIFFGKDKQIYRFGRADVSDVFVDFKGDQETFSDGFTFSDGTGFTPVADFEDSGLPIKIVREFPWSFMKKRENIKKTKFLTVDTEGSAQFTVSMFIDYYRENNQSVGDLFTDDTPFSDGSGWDQLDMPDLQPHLSMQFMGREALNFGGQKFGNSPYGGGRSTAETRTYKWPAKFKLMKLRVDGDITEELKIVGVTLSYMMGSIRRG